jgi:delta-aminolevulinic acid dehydratase/porphobilinogen synthase
MVKPAMPYLDVLRRVPCGYSRVVDNPNRRSTDG